MGGWVRREAVSMDASLRKEEGGEGVEEAGRERRWGGRGAWDWGDRHFSI